MGTARRLVVFILGGITHSEFRVASEIAEKYNTAELFIGGSKVLTPNIFIDDLKNLNSSVMDSGEEEKSPSEEEPLMGNGLSNSNLENTGAEESLMASCQNYLLRGRKLITDTFSACTSTI